MTLKFFKANFVFKNQLVTMVAKVGLRQISKMPLNCPIPKTPLWYNKHLASVFKDAPDSL